MRLRGTMRINGEGHLEIGGCDTLKLVREYGTPLYVLDEEAVRTACRRYRQAFARVYPDATVVYAGKAFLTTGMCRLLLDEGMGLDVVSAGELYTAQVAGYPAQSIYFHGNNKTQAELEMGLELGVGRFVVDSGQELVELSRAAGRLGKEARILLRITPGVEAHTHSYIQTGQVDSKFGLPIRGGQALEAVRRALELPGVELVGYHCHIGSQIFELEAFAAAAARMAEFAAQARQAFGFAPVELNLGGGLAIRYLSQDEPPAIEEYVDTLAGAVREHFGRLDLPLPRLVVEPGRSIVGEAGTTLYTVGTVKKVPGVRTYVAVDGGMGDNPRVALYGAKYEAVVAARAAERPQAVVSLAGKCCETGDMLIWDLPVPPLEPGDIVAVLSTGAYNYSMASNYNRLPRPAVVLVRGGESDLLVARETLEDLVRCDRIPPRLLPQPTHRAAS